MQKNKQEISNTSKKRYCEIEPIECECNNGYCEKLNIAQKKDKKNGSNRKIE